MTDDEASLLDEVLCMVEAERVLSPVSKTKSDETDKVLAPVSKRKSDETDKVLAPGKPRKHSPEALFDMFENAGSSASSISASTSSSVRTHSPNMPTTQSSTVTKSQSSKLKDIFLQFGNTCEEPELTRSNKNVRRQNCHGRTRKHGCSRRH